jgi:hypothetical protein
MKYDLADNVMLIAGGTGGVGSATAQALLLRGGRSLRVELASTVPRPRPPTSRSSRQKRSGPASMRIPRSSSFCRPCRDRCSSVSSRATHCSKTCPLSGDRLKTLTRRRQDIGGRWDIDGVSCQGQAAPGVARCSEARNCWLAPGPGAKAAWSPSTGFPVGASTNSGSIGCPVSASTK